MSDRLAVFNHGKVEQLGSPRQIYERPETPFVAGFVGTPKLRFGAEFPRDRSERIEMVGEFGDRAKLDFDDLNSEFYALDKKTQDEYWAGFEALALTILKANGRVN